MLCAGEVTGTKFSCQNGTESITMCFTIPPKKKKKKLFPSFMKVGPNYSHYFGKVAEKRMLAIHTTLEKLQKKEEEKELGNQKEEEERNPKKETTSFCCFAV